MISFVYRETESTLPPLTDEILPVWEKLTQYACVGNL